MFRIRCTYRRGQPFGLVLFRGLREADGQEGRPRYSTEAAKLKNDVEAE